MKYLDSPWDVNTRCSRRPTPTAFDHLREYTDLDEKYIEITTPVELQDVQEILNNQYNLYLSNEIQYVIAQLLGSIGTEFVTIKSTVDGAVHIYPMGGSVDGKMDVVLSAGTNEIGKVELIAGTAEIGTIGTGTKSIGKVQVEGPGQTMLKAVIDDSDGGNVLAIAAVADKKHKITTILLTVAGQTNIVLLTAATPLSGPMDFGGTDEPRGMVSNHGNWPLECATNEAFNITSSAAVQVSGYVIYYDE